MSAQASASDHPATRNATPPAKKPAGAAYRSSLREGRDMPPTMDQLGPRAMGG